jgi:hypothetical protein
MADFPGACPGALCFPPPISLKGPAFRFDRVPRAVARARAQEAAARRERAQEKRDQKRAERRADKKPFRVIKTAVFKEGPVRRSTSSLPAFEVHGSPGLCESSPLQELENTLQSLSVGERHDKGGSGADSLDPAGTAPAKQGKSARRRSNAAVNDMADDFSCFQLRDEEPKL